MTFLNSAILGIIQGITEMLPVSSSTHLLVFSKLRGLPDQRVSFDLFLNIGTVLAVVVFFWPQIWKLVKGGFDFICCSKTENRELFLTIILANMPVILVGGVVEHFLGDSLHSPTIISASLVIFGGILWWCDQSPTFPANSSKKVSRRDAVLTGLIQVLALVPGVSRLGACFSMLRYLKYGRLEAFRFSMILSLLPICGACLLKGIKVLNGSLVIGDCSIVALGCCFSFVFGLISLFAMTAFLKRHGMLFFVVYRVIFAIIVFVVLYK